MVWCGLKIVAVRVIGRSVGGNDNGGGVENLIFPRAQIGLHCRKLSLDLGLCFHGVGRSDVAGFQKCAFRALPIFDFVLGHAEATAVGHTTFRARSASRRHQEPLFAFSDAEAEHYLKVRLCVEPAYK